MDEGVGEGGAGAHVEEAGAESADGFFEEGVERGAAGGIGPGGIQAGAQSLVARSGISQQGHARLRRVFAEWGAAHQQKWRNRRRGQLVLMAVEEVDRLVPFGCRLPGIADKAQGADANPQPGGVGQDPLDHRLLDTFLHQLSHPGRGRLQPQPQLCQARVLGLRKHVVGQLGLEATADREVGRKRQPPHHLRQRQQLLGGQKVVAEAKERRAELAMSSQQIRLDLEGQAIMIGNAALLDEKAAISRQYGVVALPTTSGTGSAR